MTEAPLTVDVAVSPAELTEALIRDRGVVVIDVLRATTVIAHALAAGARWIVPAATVEQAIELRAQIDPAGALLCGEREGRRVSGFDLGNSPLEYRPDQVRGRTLILASTNGSVILSRCQAARVVVLASFNNVSAVAARVGSEGGPWTIVCSGKLGRACIEDLVCAGRLALLLGIRPEAEAEPSDAAGDGLGVALALHERFGGDLRSTLAAVAHGRYLAAIGFAEDLDVCAAVDSLAVVPEMIEGRIVAGEAGAAGGRKVRGRASRAAVASAETGPADSQDPTPPPDL